MKKELIKLLSIVLCILFLVLIVSKKYVVKNDYHSFGNLVNKTSVVQDIYSLQEAIIDVVEKVKPAVVSITTVYKYKVEVPNFYFGDPFEEFFREFFDMPQNRQKRQYREYRAEGGGTGFIISPDGYILTNEHVISNASEITVIVNIDGKDKEYKGRIVGRDPKTDIAVIKIESKNLPYVTLGDSDKIKVGEFVIAIGSPFGLEQTVTSGIVSAIRQRVRIEEREYREFIQTDAAINRGNSGGPLCNIKGEVIGINTAIYAPTGVFSGIGFAIPINRAKEIVDTLIQKGKVSRGWLGVEIIPVDEAIANQFGLPEKQGVLINRVIKNSPAEKAGLRRSDIILSIKVKNKVTTIESPQQLQDIVFSLPPEEKVELLIWRDNKKQSVYLKLEELPEEVVSSKRSNVKKENEKKFSWLGYIFIEITDDYRNKLSIDEDVEGVLVESIDSSSKDYEDIGLMEMDIVIGINQKETKSIEDIKRVTSSINLKKGIVLDIIRNGRQMYISYIKQ
ncbi:MAG: Do family serine endopeptidase [Endomicrobia bacterium]|nr:Do family serine endopeptidase [Endomicrobiia bacterium]